MSDKCTKFCHKFNHVIKVINCRFINKKAYCYHDYSKKYDS